MLYIELEINSQMCPSVTNQHLGPLLL